MSAASSVVFAAVHMGPYQTLAPLEPLVDGPVLYAVDGIARRHRAGRGEAFADAAAIAREGGASAFFAKHQVRGLVRGTSDDVDGENLEDVLSAAAVAQGLPVIAVEDFPGNFGSPNAGSVDALCVEAETMVAIHAARGVPEARIHVTGNPRYDALRQVDAKTRRGLTRGALGLGDEPVALWVGQPDSEDSFRTLERVLPALKAARTTLLFRAHPRDPGCMAGRYGSLLAGAGTPVRDVTTTADVTGLCCAADLVVTQFSSVAVEAGYLGTPALFALFPDLGGAYMRRRKGYAIPPWCKEKCAFLLDDAKMAAVVVDGAMHDPEAREAVRVNFAQRYATRPQSAASVARIITSSLKG